MLLVNVAQIPPEGLDLDLGLTPQDVHLEEDIGFQLEDGAELHCHIDRGEDWSVHVQGRLKARLSMECSRCLDPFALALDQGVDLYFLRGGAQQGGEVEEEVELTDRDLVLAYYDDEVLDLGRMLREQFILGLPLKGLCSETCLGLCPSCGSNRNRVSCSCAQEEPDPRLAPLRSLLDRKGSS